MKRLEKQGDSEEKSNRVDRKWGLLEEQKTGLVVKGTVGL